MSTSIRPGGAVNPSGFAAETEATSETQAASELHGGGAVEHAQATGATAALPGAQASHPGATILARLDAGEVSREQAIEGLLAHALEVHGGARLPAAQRAELESVLRAALQDDPTLAQLLGS